MTLRRTDLLGKWNAGPEVDAFFQSVEFREDGTGTVQSAGGHALCLLADFRWEFEERGAVAFSFEKTERKPWPPYNPASSASPHRIRCELEVGEFPLHVPAVMGPITYTRRLRFDESPLPHDAVKYHAQSHFFSVNQIDPMQFTVFYAPSKASDVVPDPREVTVGWRERLLRARRLQFMRFPGTNEEARDARQWIRVVADSHFLLEICVAGGDRSPLEEIVWCLPGSKTKVVGQLSVSGLNALMLNVGNQYVGKIARHAERIDLVAPDDVLVAQETAAPLWCSGFERPGEVVLATRSPAIPTLEEFGSDLEFKTDCSEVERLLLIGACVVALERDTLKKRSQ